MGTNEESVTVPQQTTMKSTSKLFNLPKIELNLFKQTTNFFRSIIKGMFPLIIDKTIKGMFPKHVHNETEFVKNI